MSSGRSSNGCSQQVERVRGAMTLARWDWTAGWAAFCLVARWALAGGEARAALRSAFGASGGQAARRESG